MNKNCFNKIFELLNLEQRQSNIRIFFDYHYTLFLYDTYLYIILHPTRPIEYIHMDCYGKIEIVINSNIIAPMLNELELYYV